MPTSSPVTGPLLQETTKKTRSELYCRKIVSVNKGPLMSDCKSPHLTRWPVLDGGCLLRALLTGCLDFPALLQILGKFQEVLGRQIAAAGERLLLSVSVLQIS